MGGPAVVGRHLGVSLPWCPASNLEDALFGHGLRTYGWLWLVVAIILFLAGLGVMARSQVSRWVGVVAGAVAAISAIWWMPYYPVWSLEYIGMGVIVIYALVVHEPGVAETSEGGALDAQCEPLP